MSSFIFLETPAGGSSWISTLLLFGPMLLVMWLFFIRPQAKKAKEQNKFSEQLEKGQEVVTISGILGKINKIDGNIVTLEVGTKSYIRMTKSSISREMTQAMYGTEAKPMTPVEETSN